MKRTLPVSLPLLFACSTSEPASPTFAGASASDGGATFVDGASDGSTSTLPNDASASDASANDASTCVMRPVDAGAGAPAPPALGTEMNSKMPGEIVSLSGFDETTAPTLAVCPETDGPTLLFSDSPETPSADGILYADTVNAGKYRLYVYQANGGNQQRKFPIVVYNPGATSTKVTIARRGLAAPSKNYVAVGKAVVADWLTDKTLADVDVPPMTRVPLDAQLEATSAQKDELVHAIFDIATTAQLKFSFVSILANGDAVAQTAGFSVLPADLNHQRGTFASADVTIRAPINAQQKGVQRLRLGGGVDTPLQGVDRTIAGGTPQTLVGNYGVLYRVELGVPTTARAGISARGGAWGGVAREETTNVLLPSATETLSGTSDAIVLGSIGPTTKLRLMSAGGSSLPIDVFLVTP